MLKLFIYLKQSIAWICAVVVLLIIQAASDLSLPSYMAQIIDVGVTQGGLASDTSYVFSLAFQMCALALINVASAVLVTLFSARIAASFSMNLRAMVFERVVDFSQAEIDYFGTASLITRTTNDIQQIQMFMVMIFRIVVYAPILGVGGIIKVLNTNNSMTWILGVGVAAVLLLVVILFVTAMPRFQKLQKLIDTLNRISREILTGLPVIRAFNNEKHEEKRFEKANTDLSKTTLFVNRVMTVMMPMMMLIMNGITLLIVFVGARYIDKGSMQVGDMMAFIQYTMQVVMSFLMLSMMSIMLPRAAVSGRRVNDILETTPSISDPTNPQTIAQAHGVVEFRDVSFRYPLAEEDVLKHISFTAYPGETTALIGSTGSGKSTLVHLIPRFYDVSEGAVLIDGVDVRHMTRHAVRQLLGFVPQKGILFSGTIASNIAFAKNNASQEEIAYAASIAQAQDFIEAKTDTYESAVSQGGTNVSGGQRQRLAIARAIVTQPYVYIFDDSFSALDYKTDAQLRKDLQTHIKTSDHPATIIIVAQRISTILHADRIIVLDEGHIVGIGTHRELLNDCEVYMQIASSQLSPEELNV